MTQEEKAKAYDKAFVIARSRYSTETEESVRICLELMFPELAESDDERIRNRLIAMCQHYIECYSFDPYNTDDYKEALAWLEKQGEQKSIESMSEFKEGDILYNKNFIDTLEVKEVDLKEEVERFAKACGYKFAATIDFQFAEHFFALGMAVSNKAQKGK